MKVFSNILVKESISWKKILFMLMESIITIPLYFANALDIYGTISVFLAWVVLQISVASWVRWYGNKGLPILQLILSLYTIYFSFPIFYSVSAKQLRTTFPINDELSRIVLLMVIVTQLCIWIGWEIGLKKQVRYFITMNPSQKRLKILAYVILAVQGFVLTLTMLIPRIDLREYSQILNGMVNLYLGMGILFYCGERYGWKIYNVIGIIIILAFFSLVSVSTTMMGEIVISFLTLGILMVRKYRWQTLIIAIAMLFAVIILQPIKLDYRVRVRQLTEIGVNLTYEQKIQLFTGIFYNHWTGNRMQLYYEETPTLQAANRLALLPLIAMIVHETPERIPYQMGETFRFLAYTAIPRFLYPDKPTAQEANVWFARAFGILDEDMAKTTMVGLSHLGEVYVNFGYIGIPIVFLIFGYVLGRISRPVVMDSDDIARKCIFVALIPGFFAIESTLTGFIGGVIYTLLFANLSMWFISRTIKRRRV